MTDLRETLNVVALIARTAPAFTVRVHPGDILIQGRGRDLADWAVENGFQRAPEMDFDGFTHYTKAADGVTVTVIASGEVTR